MSVFLEKNRGVLLAYDQGLEHGPTDFNERNLDPEFVMRLAVDGKFNGIVFMSGGPKAQTEAEFLKQVRSALDAGATGLAVGRNVWQSSDPLQMARVLRALVIDGRSLEEAVRA